MFLRASGMYVLWSVFFFCALEAARFIHRCPMELCKRCLPIEIHDAPGIGIDITTSYGTAAIYFLNGSIMDVEQVSAKPEYISLLQQLVDAPKPPPLTEYQKWRRWLNKKLGKPSTPEVGILGTLIRDISDTIRSSHPEVILDKVVITAPLLPALMEGDLMDAVEFAGLRSWLETGYLSAKRLSESRAHYAAEGKGLCQDYLDRYNCRDEEDEMPTENVYYVQFTRHALYTAVDRIQSPFYFLSGTDTYLVDYRLGMDRLDTLYSPDEFWDHIRSHLLELPSTSARPITHLQLAGDGVTSEKFLEVLKEALSELSGPLGPKQALVNISQLTASNIQNPIFAAARGAAVYAQRKQEAPWECKEPKRCEEERQPKRGAIDRIRMEL